MKNFTSLLLLLLPIVTYSQVRLQKNIQWEDEPRQYTNAQTGEQTAIWAFKNAVYADENPTLPHVSERFDVPNGAQLSVKLIQAAFVPFSKTSSKDDELLTEQLTFKTEVTRARNQSYGFVSFIPIIKKGNQYERLESYELEINWTIKPQTFAKGGGGNTRNSVLETGTIYKIAVTETGVQRLTYDFLKNDLGIALDNIDPRTIQIFGNGGGMLPERNNVARIDDLMENAIQIVGEDDGQFNENDYVLFYGEGPDRWYYQKNVDRFRRAEHFFDTRNYYFIKIDGAAGKRITEQASLSSTAYTTNEFDDYAFYEVEEVNLMDAASGAQGTGKTWFSDYFKNIKERSYEFAFPNRVVTDTIKISAQMAGRSQSPSITRFGIDLAGNERLVSTSMNGTSLSNSAEAKFANLGSVNAAVVTPGENIGLTLHFPVSRAGTVSSVAAEGWVNYIEINARRRLTMVGDQLRFRDLRSVNRASTTFQLAGSNLTIWDVSNPLAPRLQGVNTNGSQISFGVNTDTTNQRPLREFIAFNNEYFTPEAVGSVANQNVHGIDNIDFAIVYHADFIDAANRLAEHRRSHSGMDVAVVEVSEIYNEFASGKQDPTAIRDFAKMLLDRDDKFKYLLLFGDGSFDYKNIKGGTNSNFIPPYETDESLHPISGYPSDDFYGLLSENEGTPTLVGALDIGVGRLPVKTAAEANNMVNKIVHYDADPSTLGDWRLRMVWIADDEDSNTHLDDTEEIAFMSDTLYPIFNQDKIYLDAFQQVSSAGGQGYPEVTNAINNSIFKGMLAVNYLGHGGSGGWTQERVLDSDRGDIRNWSNYDKLPLFITATCSFSGYDDRNQVTAGEQVLLNPRGGGIGLLTTVRSVYASSNARLVTGVMNHLFRKIDGKIPPMGDVARIAKNSVNGTGGNNRRFTFLGDPSMQLALPQHNVVTTQIDEVNLTSSSVDTLRAFQKITIAGEIHNSDGQLLDNFNGILFPTLYDKSIVLETLGNDASSPVEDFDLQKNVIFKGRASITNGRWKFTFVVPRDINYEFGLGKISYYASDGIAEDAAGNYERVVIGGTDRNALADDRGPQVEVYMDNENFVFGGTTSPDPLLLVKLADDNGINVTGNSIGHDLEGTLDGDTQNAIRLNDFYEAALDDYTKGEVRYQLNDLEDGLHTIKIRAWDIANNPAEGLTEFIVASSAEVALKNVLNYPNPFVENTCFQFDHSLRGQEMEVLVQIFTVGGRLVKTLEANIINDGAVRQGDCIPWDGLDDFGDKLGRGVYLYKIKVRAANSEVGQAGESDFEKLVLLR